MPERRHNCERVGRRRSLASRTSVTERETISTPGNASISTAATEALPLPLPRRGAGAHIRVVERVQHGRLPQRVVQRHAARVLPVARLPIESRSQGHA